MEKIEVNSLIKFCKKYKGIYCYGAGDYGKCISVFLKNNKVNILGFIISDGQEHQSTLYGIPVYEMNEVITRNETFAIVLSLSQKFHQEVKACIQSYMKHAFIWSVTDQFIADIKRSKSYKIAKLLGPFNFLIESNSDKIKFYEEKAHEIFSKYDRILLRYIDMRQVGCVSGWMFFQNEREREQNYFFYLFCPFVYEQDYLDADFWLGKNRYLTGKFVADGIEVLSDRNLGFWKYVFDKYANMIDMEAEFDLFDYIRSFNNDVKKHLLKNTDKCYVSFTKDERQIFLQKMEEMNIERPFICISARNSLYRKQIVNAVAETEDIIDQYRNTDIHTYEMSIKYLREQSIKAVRMGALVDEGLYTPGLIDYAYKYRSDYMDVFLLSECQFFVSDPSGIQFIAQLFSKPLVTINAAILSTQNDLTLILCPDRDLVIFKKLWDTKRKRFLTIRDMLEMEVEAFVQNKVFDCGPQNTFLNYYERGIIPVDNTEEEIRDVIEEMVLRLSGKWELRLEDEILQQQYQKIVNQYPMKKNFLFQWRVGTKFLRENRWLLE